MKKPLRIFLIFFTFSILALHAHGQDPFIPRYNAVKRSERCFTVTYDIKNQFGAVWWSQKVNFSQDTAFNFVVYMGDKDSGGADGLAFVMHQDSRDTIDDPTKQVKIGGGGTFDLEAATGDDGGGLGYAMHTSRVDNNTIPGPHADYHDNHRIYPSVAVEFDTYYNNDVQDGKAGTDGNGVAQPLSPYAGWDHTSVVYNGDLYKGQQIIEDAQGNKGRILPLKPTYAFGTANNPDGSPVENIEDNRCYMFQVKWIVNPDGTQTLQLWADVYNGSTDLSGLQMIMTHTDSMLTKVFNGDPMMRFGFTGSTGGLKNEQTICLLGENLKPFAEDDYASIPVNTSTIIDVEANDNDPDGDQLHVPIIITPAKNGSAVIFDSTGVNYLRYTPNYNYVGKDSLAYVTCDVNSIKCYAKCDTAWVRIVVGCVPFNVDVDQIKPNALCVDTLPANGSAEAKAIGAPSTGSVWFEGFTDNNDDDTSDTGATAWSATSSGCKSGNKIGVKNKRFRIQGSGCEVEWASDVIDISAVTDVSATVDLEAAGGLETADYVNVYYKLDGGAEQPFPNNGQLTGKFGTVQASVDNLNGSTIQIIIKAENSASDEKFYWDNINVQGNGATTANVEYLWHRGSSANGPIAATGQTVTSLHSGAYTVVARDLSTGCLSNPTTILIDSTYRRPFGGFIDPVAPFTSCQLPYDGALQAGVFNGTDTVTNNYTFEWYYRESPKVGAPIRVGPLAQNLQGREYSVVITDNATGCDTLVSSEVPINVVIPAVKATTLSDVFSCLDPNSGVAQANVGDSIKGYDFDWWSGPAVTTAPPDFKGDTVKILPAGTYTVHATDTATGCVSDPVNVTINTDLVYPDPIVSLVSQQLSCDPANPMGELAAVVDLGGGNTTTSGFDFKWYKGLNNVVPARPGYSGGPNVDGLEVGQYRLVVANDTSGCEAIADTLIQDKTITPTLANVASTPVTTCTVTPNGTIMVKVSSHSDDYNFQLYKGSTVDPDSLLADQADSVFTDLAAGDYTVTAANKITKCTTAEQYVTVGKNIVLPDADIKGTAQKSCDPGNPNGTLEAKMKAGNQSDYTYGWYVNDLNGATVTTTNALGDMAISLDKGQYAVELTDITTACKNVFYGDVIENIQLPKLDTAYTAPSTNCTPLENGQLFAKVDGSTDANLYTFQWEDLVNNVTLPDTVANVQNVSPGDYRLTIFNKSTTCAINPRTVTVDDNSKLPVPKITVTDNTSCDPANPNGVMQVTTVGPNSPTIADYKYEWFDAAYVQLVDPDVSFSADSAKVSKVGDYSSGTVTYKLKITERATACANEVFADVKTLSKLPTIDNTAVTDAVNCSEDFGSAAEVIAMNGTGAVPAGYTFDWNDTDNGTTIAADAGKRIEDMVQGDGFALPPGNYQVIAKNTYCESDPYDFEIKDKAVRPEFSLSSVDNSSCNTALPNGFVVASRKNNSVNVATYDWFKGNISGSAFATTMLPDSIQSKLDGGDYAVQLTAANRCTSVEYVTLNDAPANLPLFDTLSTKDLSKCNTFDGAIAYQITSPSPVDLLPPFNTENRTYTFYSVHEVSFNDTTAGNYDFSRKTHAASAKPDTSIFVGLKNGYWSTVVVDDYTHCQSPPITTYLDLPAKPLFVVTPTLPGDCTSDNGGEISITSSSIYGNNDKISNSGPGYDYNWFKGPDMTTPLAAPAVVAPPDSPDKWSGRASTLVSSYYTVQVIDRLTACVVDTSIYLPANSLPEFDPQVIKPSTICKGSNGLGNGSSEVEIIASTFGTKPGNIPAGYSDYNYAIFPGDTFDPNWDGNGGGNTYAYLPGSSTPPVKFTNLDTGTYTLVAKENFGNACYSSPYTFKIELDYDMALNTTLVQADNSCAGGTATGAVTATADATGYNTTELNYTWYKGIDTSPSGSIVGGPTSNSSGPPVFSGLDANGLPASTYTIKAVVTQGDGEGCEFTKPVNVPHVKDILEIASAPVTPVDKCAFNNGTAYIADISVNGVALGSTAGFGNFTIADNLNNNITFTTAGTGADLANAWSGLGKGSYYVKAQNTTTLCVTDPFKIDIDSISQKPVVAITLDSLDYSCAPVNNTGKLTATADGSQVLTDYTFEWYNGTDAQPANQLGMPQYNAAVDPFTARKLYGGAVDRPYTVKVTDLTGANEGCVALKTKRVPHQNTTIALSLTPSDQTNCTPNGAILVNQVSQDDGINPAISETPAAPGYSLFNTKLLNSDLSANTDPYAAFDPATGLYSNMPGTLSGTKYFVRATNTVTQCVSQPVQAVVTKTAKNPVISVKDTLDYACAGGAHTGALIAAGYGGSDNDQTQLSYQWYLKGTTTEPSDKVADNHYTKMEPGDYTIIVTDIGGLDQDCQTTLDYTLDKGNKEILVTDASATPQTVCYADGTAQVNEISIDGTAIAAADPAFSNYQIYIKDDQAQPLNPATYLGTGNPADPYDSLLENTYFLQVRNTITNCYSDNKQVMVGNTSTKPKIDVFVDSAQYSFNPDPSTWTGVIKAAATEANGGYFGFEYNLYKGPNANGTLVANDSTARGLDKGLYTFWAKSDSTQCTNTATKNLPSIYLKPVFEATTKAQTICSPYDGSIQLMNMTLDGKPDNFSDYTINWHHDVFKPGSPDRTTIGDDTRTAWDNVQAGNYYIQAKENRWWVESDPVSATVEDSITYPVIDYDGTNSKPQTSCDPSAMANGALSVIAYEQGTGLPGSYNYAWYREDGTVIQDSIRSTISGLPEGKYKVVVTNTASSCQAEKEMPLEDKRMLPILTASTSPVTICDPARYNGITSAFVTNSVYDQNQDLYYTFDWSKGTDAKPAPDFTGQAWKGLGTGEYTVVVTDNQNPTCVSLPVSIMVSEKTVNPNIMVSETAPLTHCDPTNPNSAFAAKADSTVAGYSFDWYVKGGPLYFSGPNPTNLGDTTYRLVVKNIATGCASETNVRPSVSQATIPNPEVDIIGDRTSCNDPDGITTASINGNLTDYIFRFYKASNNQLLNNPVVDYKIQGLDVDNYYVTAESRQTGCVSQPTPFSIADERYFPKIDFVTTPSNCENPSGTAQVVVGDQTKPYTIYWHGDNGFEAQGDFIQFLPAGNYKVDVEGTDGCFSQGETNVDADVIIYNGVSDNNDGLNDYFQIVCLEMFPANNVKIFNRSGQLVYEQDGYDMHDPSRRFHGIANRGGINLGTELPIGTYFYVVDKNDGTKPKVGYLELNR